MVLYTLGYCLLNVYKENFCRVVIFQVLTEMNSLVNVLLLGVNCAGLIIIFGRRQIAKVLAV